jgi:tetratricopeptide (TPR) repeat protein
VKAKKNKKKNKNKRRTNTAPSVKPAAPLLSLAMMVKNEEDFLEDALRSARDFCDELIVVDTGSTDRTIEIAKDMGATLSHFPWINDFSAARNETLRQANGQWVAILDADERFVGQQPDAIRQYLTPGSNYPFEALMLNVTNTRLDGSPISSFYSVRVFPRDPRLGYTGRVHNQFGALVSDAPKIAATRYADLGIIHLGYDPELYKSRQKAARSLPLIEASVREDPSNHQQRFYLGREYLTLGRLDEAIPALQLAFDGIVATGDGPLVGAATHLIQALLSSNAPAVDAVKIGQQALQLESQHPDLWFDVGRALIRAGSKEAGADAVIRALGCLSKPGFSDQIRLQHRQWEAHELLGQLYWDMSRYAEAYKHYTRALDGKPTESDRWPIMLNSLCALAIEFGDDKLLPGLLDRLLNHPEAPLGMFFFQLNKVRQSQGTDAARLFLQSGLAKCARMSTDGEYLKAAKELDQV